jgi:hypothetical protein
MQKYMHLLFTSLNSLDKTLLSVLLNSVNLFFFLHFASTQQHYCIRMLPLSFSGANPSLLSCKMTALKSLHSPLLCVHLYSIHYKCMHAHKQPATSLFNPS